MKATNFHMRISKEQAEEALKHELDTTYGFDIMAENYGDTDDWTGITSDDLDEESGTLDEDWGAFEIWFHPKQDDAKCPDCNLKKAMHSMSDSAQRVCGNRRCKSFKK